MTTGKAIRRILKKRGMTQRHLADVTGLSTTAINQIILGQAEPHRENLEKIARALRVPISLIRYYSMDLRDVPENKQQAYLTLRQSMTDLLEKTFFPDDTQGSTDNS